MSSLFLTVLSLSLACSLAILCVILLNKIFRKNYSRQWIYIIWAVIALRLIVPVNIGVIDLPKILNIDINSQEVIPAADSAANTNSIQSGGDTAGKTGQPSADVVSKEENAAKPDTVTKTEVMTNKEMPAQKGLSFPKADTMAVIWIAGVILFLFYHMTAYLYYRRKVARWSIALQNKEVLERFNGLCQEIGIKRKIKLVTSTQVPSPVLIGFLRPCIVLPMADFTGEQYYFILKHELIHYKHHDLAYKFILLLANSLHWFNPLVYYMVYLANNDIELYCDETLVAQKNLDYRENYSKILLQVMTGTGKNNILLSTGFSGKKKQIKNRFFQIMNAKPTKKGLCFIVGMVCLIVLAGNLASQLLPAKASNVPVNDMQTNLINKEAASDLLQVTAKPGNILVVGIDGIGGLDRADSILVAGVNPDTKGIYLTSFLRDMYLEIPDHGKNKLMAAYELGDAKLVKETLEANFGFTIDYTVTVNMKAFENIIDSIGGVNVELSEEEAEYLNRTNYISNKKYRTVKQGEQILNGNQALGYARIRKVPTLQGERDDLGRTARLRKMLSGIVEEYSKKDINELIPIWNNALSYVDTDLTLDQIMPYLTIVLQKEVKTNTLSIPAEGSYTPGVQDGMSVLVPDLEANKAALAQIYN
ncbi:M56 family metallopeptidase [Anaerocolumna xylanovorans]|uniref:Transcriptional attenuator, LytR family n=1 Tax=Anaerocolumna xylanovorans DSM 12503 TaxID=1121345 RepID=A0A1M7Y5S3_9FIRM|nr:M56 family metallopeptidase [Anaerocolumna xylanovorans]SHO47648.1 transcriptional attenuator, LytR family [Anaerocolumna xylanovorans DSM 12503]